MGKAPTINVGDFPTAYEEGLQVLEDSGCDAMVRWARMRVPIAPNGLPVTEWVTHRTGADLQRVGAERPKTGADRRVSVQVGAGKSPPEHEVTGSSRAARAVLEELSALPRDERGWAKPTGGGREKSWVMCDNLTSLRCADLTDYVGTLPPAKLSTE